MITDHLNGCKIATDFSAVKRKAVVLEKHSGVGTLGGGG